LAEKLNPRSHFLRLVEVGRDFNLDGHEENLGDEDHEGDVVGRVGDLLTRQQVLQDWEEGAHEVMKWLTLLLYFKFKRLENAF